SSASSGTGPAAAARRGAGVAGGADAGRAPGPAAGRTAIDSRDGLSHDSTAPGGSAGAGGGAAAGPSGAAVHGVFSSDPWSGRDASTGAGVMPKARSGSASAAVFGCTTGAPIGVWPSGSAAGVPEPRPNSASSESSRDG